MFPVFPEFRTVTMEDRTAYEHFMAQFPSVSDLSFTTLMLWWNLDSELEISSLRNNFIIHYRAPNDEANSGYAVVGTTEIRESLHEVMAYLRDANQPVRLVHVPEFVIATLTVATQDEFNLVEEVDYNEYLLDAQELSTFEDPKHSRTRRKVRQFLREAGEEQVRVDMFDLTTESARQTLLSALGTFEHHGRSRNDPNGDEMAVMLKSINQASELGMRCLVVHVADDLQGFALYQHSQDEKYFIVNHLKAKDTYPHLFDYVTQQLAQRALREDVPYLNYEMDLGIDGLRFHKLGLRPFDFFRKYTITDKQ